jgi:type II secretory pathway pseudopilin PulG
MDTRKITLIATIAVIALVAVGVGYAYTASTQNSTNSASGEYVTLTQAQTTGAADGSYKFANGAKVYFDTTNTALDTTTYSLSGIKDTTTFAGYTVVQVGNPFDLVATQTNGSWPE